MLPCKHALALVLCVIPPAGQMQKTVNDEKGDLLFRRVAPCGPLRQGVIDRNHELSALDLPGRFAGGKRHDVGRGVDSHEVPVEGLQARVIHEGNCNFPTPKCPFRGEDERRQRLQPVTINARWRLHFLDQ